MPDAAARRRQKLRGAVVSVQFMLEALSIAGGLVRDGRAAAVLIYDTGPWSGRGVGMAEQDGGARRRDRRA